MYYASFLPNDRYRAEHTALTAAGSAANSMAADMAANSHASIARRAIMLKPFSFAPGWRA